jgi:preprotein translocase subunit YajC
MTPEERALFEKRRRGRNIAILFVLVVMTVIFYFVGMARILRG